MATPHLDIKGLRAEAVKALEAAGATQSAAASAIGVSQGVVSRALALGDESARYAQTLIRIVEHFTPFSVEAVPARYILTRRKP